LNSTEEAEIEEKIPPHPGASEMEKLEINSDVSEKKNLQRKLKEIADFNEFDNSSSSDSEEIADSPTVERLKTIVLEVLQEMLSSLNILATLFGRKC